ncbi:hypothetical protein [Streptomyces sp. NPDC051214]|uniref:hypothetical protein n=1 Tax=Streptomyces sp. NPDC051214 TaxID=3155282 RepID=UPI00343C0FE7
MATYIGPQSLLDHDALVASLQQADRQRGGLEHARVHASGAGMRGVLFISGMDSDAARIYCRDLFEQAVLGAPELTGWSLAHCDVLPIA